MWRGVERRVNRRFSISAKKVSVRPHVPWYLRWGLLLPFIFALLGLVWFAYDSGMEIGGFNRSQSDRERSELNKKVIKLKAENTMLSDQIAKYERQIEIEQSSNQVVAEQMKNLSDENARLQEDLAFFQNITATQGKSGELGVHRLTLVQDTMPGEYHLRMLLVQSGTRVKTFKGNYQLIATVSENGQSSSHVFPRSEDRKEQFKLNFRYYQRVEQSIQLPLGVELDSVQVRIFEQGVLEPKVRQRVSLAASEGV